MMLFQQLKCGISHLVYPRLCEGCNQPLLAEEDVLCIGCYAHLPFTEYAHIQDNETELRFSGRFPFVRATSLAYFTNDGLLQHLLHGLKYRGKKEIGYFLGTEMGRSLKDAQWSSLPDAIIPVPLHPKKEAQRGYNQSQLLGEGLGLELEIPVMANILFRSRNTESQTQKSRTERLANMQNAFAVKHANLVEGKHILLLDDVLTTGATIEACALALLALKDVRVSVATIGIAA